MFNELSVPAIHVTREKPPVILVPTDFSTAATEAVKFAVNVALQARGRLLLVHAIHLNLNPYGPVQVSQLKAKLCEEAFSRSEGLMMETHEAGVPVICAVEEGEPVDVIARAAKRWEADLIILAERQRNPFTRWLRRNTAERLIHEVDCPVMVLKNATSGECL